MVDTDARETFDPTLSGTLGRRLYAAVIDMLVVAVVCFAILQADSVLVPVIVRQAGGPAKVVLALLLLVEAITGRSAGKLAMGLRLERMTSGKPAAIWQPVVRAAVRWLGPLISVASLLTQDMTTAGLLVCAAMTLVICEVPACYITLFRTGGTVFDLIARTRVAAV
jgi:hypothetical protein